MADDDLLNQMVLNRSNVNETTIDPSAETATSYLATSVSTTEKRRGINNKRYLKLMNFFHTHLSNERFEY